MGIAHGEVSHDFCQFVYRPRIAAREFCYEGPLPGGDYGVQLRKVMKRSDAEVSLRTGLLSDEFTPDEQMAVLRAIQPKVEESVERTRESVVALSPPAEFEADHDRLLLFLSETLDVAQELTAAASGGDFDKVESELP